MANIQSSSFPLAFPVALNAGPATAFERANATVVRVLARNMDGMQKEALVSTLPGNATWRLVSDEGPYLNGTDLAPFPLAFFTTGLVNATCTEIMALAKAQGLVVRNLELIQDNKYTMEGSAIRGDMTGGALPVRLQVKIDADAPASVLNTIIDAALARSPAEALLRGVFKSEFSIVKNGLALPVGGVARWPDAPDIALDDALFDTARPCDDTPAKADIITKLSAAETVFDREGGAGSSLTAEQKRVLHVRGRCVLRPDGLTETRVQLLKPIGSTFRFIADIDDQNTGARAPSALAYLAAGIAFCYLTQIGRYAHIMKHKLESYKVAQFMEFTSARSIEDDIDAPQAGPVRSHVSIRAEIGDDTARRIVDMGEQTCFLHALCRTPVATEASLG